MTMASKESCLSSESDPSGYEYEFIDKIPEDLLCQRCKHVAREPNFTTCCGELFCKECISLYHHNNQPCPICEETGFNVGLKKRDQKKILALKLYCPMKSRGCEWMGRLEQLEGHMDVQSGDCLYVDMECPSHCDQRVQKRNVQNHLSQECPLREYMCTHCNFKASYKLVSEDHWRVCSYLPVQCPNRCGVTCERQDLEDHMKICGKEELECCFSHAGCQGRFLREDEEMHMEENTKKHLPLMATTMLKISKKMEKQEVMFQDKLEQQKVEFQEKLQEQEVKHQKLLQEKLQEKEDKLRKEHQEQEVKLWELLQEQDEKFQGKLQEQERQTEMKFCGRALEEYGHYEAIKLKDINDKVAELQYNTGYVYIFPVTITMPLYEQLKAENKWWYSPVMYTESEGYSFRIVVFPNGHPKKDGHGTHVSVAYAAEVGSYDAQVKWPVTITVSIQLLNQHADRDHITKDISRTYDKKDCTGLRVIHKFISHEKLDWNAEKETLYLKNNCLQFKVVEAEVQN